MRDVSATDRLGPGCPGPARRLRVVARATRRRAHRPRRGDDGSAVGRRVGRRMVGLPLRRAHDDPHRHVRRPDAGAGRCRARRRLGAVALARPAATASADGSGRRIRGRDAVLRRRRRGGAGRRVEGPANLRVPRTTPDRPQRHRPLPAAEWGPVGFRQENPGLSQKVVGRPQRYAPRSRHRRRYDGPSILLPAAGAVDGVVFALPLFRAGVRHACQRRLPGAVRQVREHVPDPQPASRCVGWIRAQPVDRRSGDAGDAAGQLRAGRRHDRRRGLSFHRLRPQHGQGADEGARVARTLPP